MQSSHRLTSTALFLCVFLAVFTEVLLSPFYPQFFRKVFGVEDLQYTGYYIFVCRLTVVICAPLWGWLSRRVAVRYLLCAGQAGTAIMTALMATATSAEQFLIYTIALLLFKSSYLMVYPLIIQIAGTERRSAIAGLYQAVFHGAIIAATVAGAWMVNLDAPLFLFYWIALADLLQLGLCLWVLRSPSAPQEIPSSASTAQPSSGGDRWGFMVILGVVILTFQLANNLVRPFFTEYILAPEPFGIDLLSSSVIFLIPSLMAIAAMPFIRRVAHPPRLPLLYTVGMGCLALSLLGQGWGQSLGILIFSRVVYGFFLAVTQAVLELHLFSQSSQQKLHFNYSLITAFGNVGHLGAPLLASQLVSTYTLASPLIAAGLLSLANVLFARFVLFSPQLTPSEDSKPKLNSEVS